MGNKINQDKLFFDALCAMDCGRGMSYSNIFDEFLDMALSTFCNNPTERQRELWSMYSENKTMSEAFLAAILAYGEAADVDYHDPLGDFFMEYISHGQNGQYFTPEPICGLLADITGVNGDSVNDPACGSGRTLLAGLRSARKSGCEPFLYGNDISYTCAKMTLLNLLCNSARGEVTCGDALRYDLENFTFFRIERTRRVLGGITPWASFYWRYTKSDVESVNEKRNELNTRLAAAGFEVEYVLPLFGAVAPEKRDTPK